MHLKRRQTQKYEKTRPGTSHKSPKEGENLAPAETKFKEQNSNSGSPFKWNPFRFGGIPAPKLLIWFQVKVLIVLIY